MTQTTLRARRLGAITDSGVIGILRGVDGEETVPVVRALAAGGVTAVEITADTEGVEDELRRVREAVGDDVLLGAGTVLDAETAQAVIAAGASFVVTPTLDESVIRTANRYAAPVIPGVSTPTEALRATEYGADMVKLFPASSFGPGHVRALRGPLEQIGVVPTGGVGLDTAAEYFDAGAVAVGVGSALVDDTLVERGAYDELTERAAAFASRAEAHRSP